jgi:hypothetical protein
MLRRLPVRHYYGTWPKYFFATDPYIVPEASDGDVADTACSGRILLVEQQVSLPLFLKTETDIQATFTSHHARLPQAHA